MKGHGEKLTRKQKQAISALLTQPTAGEAAAAGVSDVTLWRWLRLPQFQLQYRAARRQIVESAIANLQRTAGRAVEALSRNLTCGQPAVEVRAALGVLDQSIKAVELLDLEERLNTLERLLDENRMQLR